MISVTIMPGSTLAVISLQLVGSYASAVKQVFYKKSSDSTYSEWTGGETPKSGSYLYPYFTTWKWFRNHWQIVIDELDPGTQYDIYLTVNGSSTSIAAFTTDDYHEPWAYKLDHGREPDTSRDEDLDVVADDFMIISQAVGLRARIPMGFMFVDTEGTASAAGGAYGPIHIGPALLDRMITKSSAAVWSTFTHELRHALGLATHYDTTDASPILVNTTYTQANGKRFRDENGQYYVERFHYNEVGADEIAPSGSSTGTIYWSKYNVATWCQLDQVLQFIYGSPLAHARMFYDHSNCPDYLPLPTSRSCDITHWFILKALALNKINFVNFS